MSFTIKHKRQISQAEEQSPTPEINADQWNENHDFADLIADLLTYLKLDGSRAMAGDLWVPYPYYLKLWDAVRLRGSTGNKLRVVMPDSNDVANIVCGMLEWSTLRTFGTPANLDTNLDIGKDNILNFRQQNFGNLYTVMTMQLGGCYIPRAGDITHVSNTVGPILTDRTTATKYRLYVDNGALNIEAI